VPGDTTQERDIMQNILKLQHLPVALDEPVAAVLSLGSALSNHCTSNVVAE
jgi:hypothetical protein